MFANRAFPVFSEGTSPRLQSTGGDVGLMIEALLMGAQATANRPVEDTSSEGVDEINDQVLTHDADFIVGVGCEPLLDLLQRLRGGKDLRRVQGRHQVRDIENLDARGI